MNRIQETSECGRGEQLIAYLYGESDARERADFEGHLAACAACGAELSAFAQVRESVGEWRAQLLAHAPGVEADGVLPTLAPISATSNVSAAEAARRTAWDALREFFALSPAWLRYGSVAAALVVCALAALAVANARVSFENGSVAFSTGLSREAVKTNSSTQAQMATAGDASQLNQLVAERDSARRELEETRAQLEDSRAANIDAVYQEIDESQPEDAAQSDATAASRQRRAPAAQQRRPARRPRQSEDDLPRLIDLLSSGNE